MARISSLHTELFKIQVVTDLELKKKKLVSSTFAGCPHKEMI
jgi:hypothetical protein